MNIDGKVLRGTSQAGKKKSGLCLVSAWASEQKLCLGQLKTEEKSNEKTAIPALINAQAVKWIEEYPVVYGLANLFGRLGYNSMFHVLCAVFLQTPQPQLFYTTKKEYL